MQINSLKNNKRLFMKMKPHFILSMLLIFTFGFSHAQNTSKDFPILKGPYLGQKLPGITPEVFASGILSNDKIGAFCSVFSPDGKEFYYVRFMKDVDGSGRIYWTRRVNNIWTKPKPAPFGSDYRLCCMNRRSSSFYMRKS